MYIFNFDTCRWETSKGSSPKHIIGLIENGKESQLNLREEIATGVTLKQHMSSHMPVVENLCRFLASYNQGLSAEMAEELDAIYCEKRINKLSHFVCELSGLDKGTIKCRWKSGNSLEAYGDLSELFVGQELAIGTSINQLNHHMTMFLGFVADLRSRGFPVKTVTIDTGCSFMVDPTIDSQPISLKLGFTDKACTDLRVFGTFSRGLGGFTASRCYFRFQDYVEAILTRALLNLGVSEDKDEAVELVSKYVKVKKHTASAYRITLLCDTVEDFCAIVEAMYKVAKYDHVKPRIAEGLKKVLQKPTAHILLYEEQGIHGVIPVQILM